MIDGFAEEFFYNLLGYLFSSFFVFILVFILSSGPVWPDAGLKKLPK